MTTALVIVASVSLFMALSHGERNAWRRRAQRLDNREPAARSDWYVELPELPPSSIDRGLDLVASVLEVNSDRLHTHDELNTDLSLITGFFCFVEDDDTVECLRDRIEDETGIRPSGHWVKLRDVVIEFSAFHRVE